MQTPFRPLALTAISLLGLCATPLAAQADTEAPVPQQEAVPTMADGQAQLQQQQWQQAAVIFAQIVLDQPDNAQAWHLLGYSLHASGDLDRALVVHRKAASFPATQGIATYNIACVHALQGRPDEAFAALEQARQAGFGSAAQLQGDSDLSSLHADPRWQQLLARVRGDAEAVAAPSAEAEARTGNAPAAAARGDAVDLNALEPAQRFDFWLGEWEVRFNDVSIDKWTVQRRLNGRAIEQQAKDSVTLAIFEPVTQKWHMTWMSQDGAHDVLVGGLEGDNKLVMHQDVIRDEPGKIGRWIFRDVHRNFYLSDWQTSTDRGQTWTTEFTLNCWRAGTRPTTTAAEAAAAPPLKQAYDFSLGTFEVEFRAMLPDQTWTNGSGSSVVTRKDDGSLIEKIALRLEDGTPWEGTTVRRFDPEAGQWKLTWTSATGGPAVEATARYVDGTLVEFSSGQDQHGSFRDRLHYLDTSENGYRVRLDRQYEDGPAIEGLYEATAVRKQ